jgi:hypothetical protein
MTHNPVTIAMVEADKLPDTKRSWLREGLRLHVPLPRLALMMDVPVVAVRSVLIADRDEFDDETWERYRVEL